MVYAFCRNFKLFELTRFFPPVDLVKFYTSLPFLPFETLFNPLSSTGSYYLHRLRELVSPVCGIFCVWFNVFTRGYDAIAWNYLGWISPLEEIGQSLNQRMYTKKLFLDPVFTWVSNRHSGKCVTLLKLRKELNLVFLLLGPIFSKYIFFL